MKCKYCGAELKIKDDKFYCDYCNSSFIKEEYGIESREKKSDFLIKGGVLTLYLGNKNTVVIPDGVISIGNSAFKNNLSIQSVVFSKSVKLIDANAFEGCTNLKKICSYEQISSYGDEAFMNSGLTYISINNNVEYIGKYCFSKMPFLEEITYTPNRNLRLNHAFSYCPNLRDVEMDRHYFFPSMHSFLNLRNNPKNDRPTWHDAFVGTPFIRILYEKYKVLYKKGICPECGGKIKKSFFHAKCKNCKIDYKN